MRWLDLPGEEIPLEVIMDISNIPKPFWYSVSFCIVFLTISFVVIAWKSTSLTIEIANAKVSLSQAATRTEIANKQLRNVAEELYEERAQLESLREEILQLASHAGSESNREIASVLPPAEADAGDEYTKSAVDDARFSIDTPSERVAIENKFEKITQQAEQLKKQKLPPFLLKKQKEKLEEISKELDRTQMQIQQIKK